METSSKVTTVTYLKVTIDHYEPVTPAEVVQQVRFSLMYDYPFNKVEAVNRSDPRA